MASYERKYLRQVAADEPHNDFFIGGFPSCCATLWEVLLRWIIIESLGRLLANDLLAEILDHMS